jgi:hypothetical protein
MGQGPHLQRVQIVANRRRVQSGILDVCAFVPRQKRRRREHQLRVDLRLHPAPEPDERGIAALVRDDRGDVHEVQRDQMVEVQDV